jgi:hypothetical protein
METRSRRRERGLVVEDGMREALEKLIDKPVIIRTLPQEPRWEPTTGMVFAVRDDAVDVQTSSSTMKTIRLAMIVDATLDTRAAAEAVLEDPPAHSDYPAAKVALFEAEQSQLIKQPAEVTRGHAVRAAGLLRGVRKAFPQHLYTEQMLERAHFMATGRYDYEVDSSITTGDVPNHNYRWARERSVQLDEALKIRRSEDEVAGILIHLARYSGRALAKYPAHTGLKAWFDKAETIRKKLSDEIRRSNHIAEPFTP